MNCKPLLVAALTLALAACSKVTLENYGKLKMGQKYEEVTAIIGEPSHCDETLGVRSCAWGSEQQGITVNFFGGQVVLLSARNLK
ncbi:hypothetical protein ACLSSQ_15730 [Azospira sp. APE16]|mgnify:FL=1|uniref:hypothetical protein n=1 Tax=Azospira sp. APE16 TaxID=3394231 RepID=UPI003A4E1197